MLYFASIHPPFRMLLILSAFLVLSSGGGATEAEGAVLQDAQGADDVVVTARQNNYVREGPGSFHEVLVAVKKDVPLEVLEEDDDWIRVRLPDDRSGWIANTSVQRGTDVETPSMQDVADEWTTTETTESGVAAAVRGFQMRVDELEDGSTKALLQYIKSTPPITAGDVEHFRRPLEAGDDPDLDLGDLDVDLESFDPPVEEQQVGFAVAGRLVSKGLVESRRVQRYLTLLTEQLTANTLYYDVDFDVVIIEGRGPDAFAAPGGILFLTRGVFTNFEDEAQLAGLLAHEIAHVVRHHGMTERDERSVRRKSDEAFTELDEVTEDEDDKFAEVEEDMEAMMQKSYERVVNDRLLKYEKEADRIAAALLGEAGYSPMGIVDAVQRITALRADDPDLFDEEYLEAQNAEERLRSVRSFVDRHDGQDGRRLPNRFRAYDEELR